MSNAFELTVTKTIPAAPKTVFEAWLNPKALSAFMKPGPGMSDARVECDPTEGGNFLGELGISQPAPRERENAFVVPLEQRAQSTAVLLSARIEHRDAPHNREIMMHVVGE